MKDNDSYLRDVQNGMLEALISPETDNAFAEALLPGARLSAAECFAIYRRSYILRLRRCLEAQFPASRHALGDDLFTAFADAYLEACPSASYTLNALGQRFPQWLEDNRPDRDTPESWIDFMVDLAEYECTLYRLFDATGHEGGVWPESSTPDRDLRLQPCLELTVHRFPVAWYYHEVKAGRRPGYPPAETACSVILRRDFVTHTFPVTGFHHRFLTLVGQTGNADAAITALAAEAGIPRDDVADSWRRDVREAWMDAGFFIRV